MQGSDAGKLRDPRVPPIPPIAILACWALGALVFAFLPQGSEAKSVIATVFSLSTAAFAAVILLHAAPRAEGHERAFLRLMGLGIVSRLAGNSLWSASQHFGLGIVTPVAPQDVAYAISYSLLVGAMLHLVALTSRRITLVSALDAGAVMLSVGTLALYFVLGPAAAGLGSVREAEQNVAGKRKEPPRDGVHHRRSGPEYLGQAGRRLTAILCGCVRSSGW